MANSDYPGPCPSCGGVNGCGSEDLKQQAVENFCQGLNLELDGWKSRLYDVLAQVDQVDVKDKERLDDTLILVKSTVKELENIRDEIREVCPVDLGGHEAVIGNKLAQLRQGYTDALGVISPGSFGG